MDKKQKLCDYYEEMARSIINDARNGNDDTFREEISTIE